MHRRNILKALFFGVSTVEALVSGAQPVADVLEEKPDDAKNFKSKWHKIPDMPLVTKGLKAQPLQDWCIRNGELVCLTQKPDRAVLVSTHHLSDEHKSFRAEMVFRFMDEPAVTPDNIPYSGFRFGTEEQFDSGGKGVTAGINRGGNLFIGKISGNKNVLENILREYVRLVLSVIPQSGGGCFAKLKALDGAGNTLATLSSTEHDLPDWRGNITILSHFIVPEANAGKPSVAVGKFEISGEKLSYHPDFEVSA